jgi:hypothetical protein
MELDTIADECAEAIVRAVPPEAWSDAVTMLSVEILLRLSGRDAAADTLAAAEPVGRA